MKYLDEDIYVKIEGFNATASTTYDWVLENENDMEIFRGKVFIESGSTSYSFYINDIINQYRKNAYRIEEVSDISYTKPFTEQTIQAFLFDTFRITLDMGGGDGYSNSVDVCLIYRYPNRKTSMSIPVFQYGSGNTSVVREMLQGYDDVKREYKLTPKYPHISTYEYPFALTIESNKHSDNMNFYGNGGLVGSFSKAITAYSNTYLTPLANLYSKVRSVTATVTMVDFAEMEYIGNDTYKNTNNTSIGQCDLKVGTEETGSWNYRYDYYLDYGTTHVITPIVITNQVLAKLQSDEDWYLIELYDSITQDMPLISFSIHFNGVNNSMIGKILNISFDVTKVSTGVQDDDDVYITKPIASFDLGGGYIELAETTATTNTVAIVDECPSKYYLMWIDRGGSYQSQPFNDKVTYTENFDRVYTENYRHEKSLKNLQITPKWKINSDWIPEDVYPLYEGIFTSPYLLLYDSEEDCSYNVTVTGDWTEKTYKNQKSLINLTLELEHNKVQNMIY